VLQVGLGVIEQIPAHRDYSDNRDYLK